MDQLCLFLFILWVSTHGRLVCSQAREKALQLLLANTLSELDRLRKKVVELKRHWRNALNATVILMQTLKEVRQAHRLARAQWGSKLQQLNSSLAAANAHVARLLGL